LTSYRLVITSHAKAQVREAAAWWRRERPAARTTLTDELHAAFELLLQHPLAGRRIDDPAFRAVRRLALNRTHYYLFYELREEEIVIVGFRHQSREG
jgi:plasmid stabilization system protein ParE